MEEKPCGLIAIIPPALQTEWSTRLALLTKRFKPAALILQNPDAETASRIIEAARAFELAVLLADAAEEAAKLGANGVYFTHPGAALPQARAALGSASVIGVACGLSRHAAMESAEAGADFVAFGLGEAEALDEAAELSFWWDEMTIIPSALACGAIRPTPSVLSKARSDFLLVSETHEAGESLTFATEFGLQSQM